MVLLLQCSEYMLVYALHCGMSFVSVECEHGYISIAGSMAYFPFKQNVPHSRFLVRPTVFFSLYISCTLFNQHTLKYYP